MSITYSETDAHVAAEVRAEMARQRLPMRELARRLGVTSSWLHRRVTGDVGFGAGELADVADVMDVPVEQFYAGRKRLKVRRTAFKRLVSRFAWSRQNDSDVITASDC